MSYQELPFPGTPIIVDIGSAYIKIGFAGDKEPRFVFPCITGTEKYRAVMADVNTRSIYVGDDAVKMRGVLKLSRPIQRGNIMDWNNYYEILNYIFYSLLRVEDLAQYPVLYVEQPFVPRETKEYIARVLFETHRVKSLMMVPSPLLSVFSVGLTTGLVIESGDGVTWIVPVINGQIYTQAVQRLDLAGHDVNQNLMALMMREGIMMSSSGAEQILQEIKEQNCYIVLDTQNPPYNQENLNYPMPDGSYVSIPGRFFYEAPEVMFQPQMLGYSIMNIPQAIIYSLQMTPREYWAELLSHIVLSGGNLSYNGFDERLRHELRLLLPQLGPIPKPQPQADSVLDMLKPETPSASGGGLKLQSFDLKQKDTDTCSQCGELVDLSDGKEFCPNCGAPMKVAEISIDLGLGKKKEKKTKKGRCPHCGKDIRDSESVFCPYCGKNVEELPELKSVDEIMKQAPLASEFSDIDESEDEDFKLYIPDNLQYAVFNGAAVLGGVLSFQVLFITHQQFQADPNLLYRDISEVLR